MLPKGCHTVLALLECGEAVCPDGMLQGGGCPQPHQCGGLAELCLFVLLCVKAPRQCIASCCL